MSNSWAVTTSGADDLMRGLAEMGALGFKNLNYAIQDVALWARGELAKDTPGSVAEHWRVENDGKSTSVVNPSEAAVYLEYGVGLYNEGPGHKGYIVPRKSRDSFWAIRYRLKHGKEPPRVLAWKDEETGKMIFAKKVKGFKARRMVRNNLPRIQQALAQALNTAATATLRGERYV